MKSVSLFNKHSLFIEDCILGNKKFLVNTDKAYYKKVLKNHFISNSLKHENFSMKAKRVFDNLKYD